MADHTGTVGNEKILHFPDGGRTVGYVEILKEMGLTEENLPENEYEDALKYARRKAKLTGHDEGYIPLLLPDVIKERLFSRFTIDLASTIKEVIEIFIFIDFSIITMNIDTIISRSH